MNQFRKSMKLLTLSVGSLIISTNLSLYSEEISTSYKQKFLRDETSQLIARGKRIEANRRKIREDKKIMQSELKKMVDRREMEKYLDSIGCCYDKKGKYDANKYSQKLNEELKKKEIQEKKQATKKEIYGLKKVDLKLRKIDLMLKEGIISKKEHKEMRKDVLGIK